MAREKVEDEEEDSYREKRGFHTDETEGEIRSGALEDEANERWPKMNTNR